MADKKRTFDPLLALEIAALASGTVGAAIGFGFGHAIGPNDAWYYAVVANKTIIGGIAGVVASPFILAACEGYKKAVSGQDKES